MRECCLEQICTIFLEEQRVGHVRISHLCPIEQRRLDLVCFNKLKHSCEKETLKFKATLMISIRKDKEDVLQDAQEVLLEEGVANSRLCTCKVVDHLETH